MEDPRHPLVVAEAAMTRSRGGGRVVLAGLAAGVALNLSGIASALLVGLGDSFARLGIEPTAGDALLHVTLRLAIGLAVAYLYAGLVPRFGSGPQTVMRLGILVWIIGYVPGIAILHETGFLRIAQALASVIWGLGEAMLGVGIAAAVYGRPQTAVEASAAHRPDG